TPNSVAFSSAHSKRSNFTSASSSRMRARPSRASTGSTSANSTRSSPRFGSSTRSIRASHTRLPSLSSQSWPGSARSTRPRCAAESPVSTARSALNCSTKKRRRTESDSIANAGKKIGQAQASIAAAGSALVLQGAVAQFQPAVDGLKAVLHAENVRLVVPLKDLRRDLQPETIACLSRLAVARHRESGDTLAPARYMLDTQRTLFPVRICLIPARQVPARTVSHLETAGQ